MKRILIGFVVSAAVAASLLALTGGSARAQGASSDTDMSRKLDEIMKGQKAIQDDIAAIKQELAVIKVRVTQNQ